MQSRDALVVVASDGTVGHRKALIELFSEQEAASLLLTGRGVRWCGGRWIDEKRKEVVVLISGCDEELKAIPRLFRIVDLESGKVRDGSSDVVLSAIAEANLGGLDRALEVAVELGLARAKPGKLKVFSDERKPLKSRLLAAVALVRLGDRRGGDLMKRAALGDIGERWTAIQYPSAVIGDEAAPVLCEVVRQFDEKWSSGARQAMQEGGGRPCRRPCGCSGRRPCGTGFRA